MIEETPIPAAEMQAIQRLLPGHDPILSRTGRIVPVADVLLDGNELLYVTQCIKSNWISSAGPFIGAFEKAFAHAVGCRHALACSNGTTALHLALAALGLGPDDEVIVPTFTMIATANAVAYTGAVPILVDAEPVTWNLDVAQLEAHLSPRTRAIVVVHTYGNPQPRPTAPNITVGRSAVWATWPHFLFMPTRSLPPAKAEW
jgi:dTDP-4-amino-4,6-dideoxygalactose transaminase